MKAAPDGHAQLALGEEIISLGGCELDRLLESLTRFRQHDADSLREEIRALRLGGMIRLLPTEAELASSEVALDGLAADDPPPRPQSRRNAGRADDLMTAGEPG